VRAIQIAEPLAQAPKVQATAAKAGKDTARSTIFVNVQRRIAAGIAIANIDARVHAGKVAKLHPKGTVVGIDKAHLLGNAGIFLPLFGLVRPIALPFVRAPRIAQLHQLEGLALGFGHAGDGFFRHFDGRNQTVRVTGDQADAFHHLLSGGTVVLAVFHFANRGGHEGLLFVVLFEQCPNLVGRILFLGFAESAGPNVVGILFGFHGHHILADPLFAFREGHLKDIVARHGQPTPQDKAAFNIRITPAQFRIGLFQQNGPQFVAIGFHEAGLFGALFAGNVIVNGDHDPFFLQGMIDANLVQTARIEFLGQEHVTNHIGEFGGAGKGRHEPAIADGALTQIVGFNVAFEQLRRLVAKGIQILGADPIGVLFHLFPRRFAGIVFGMVAQGLGAKEFVVLVGPSDAATKVLPQASHDATLTEDGGAGNEVNFDALDEQSNGAHDGTAEAIPEKAGSARVDFLGGRHVDDDDDDDIDVTRIVSIEN